MTNLLEMDTQAAADIEIDYSAIDIEDGEPVDNIFSEKQMRLLTEPIYNAFPGQRVAALANVGLFYAVRQPPIVPDVMLSVDVELKPQTGLKKDLSYFIWELGKAPDVAIEIVSNRSGGEDTSKVDKYVRAGVVYYAIFDPESFLSKRPLRVFQRSGFGFVDVLDPAKLPPLSVGLKLWDGVFEERSATWLRWVDAHGDFLPTGAESTATARKAEKQAREAEQQALERVERLAARLRELGVDPDA